jgi:hypothetical protein
MAGCSLSQSEAPNTKRIHQSRGVMTPIASLATPIGQPATIRHKAPAERMRSGRPRVSDLACRARRGLSTNRQPPTKTCLSSTPFSDCPYPSPTLTVRISLSDAR